MAESGSVVVNRKLCELRVIDLKNELEKRGLEKNGVKQALFERLKTSLVEEGHDPESYTIEVSFVNTPNRSKKTENSQDAAMTYDDGDMNNQISIGFDEDYSELLQPKKDDMNSVTSSISLNALEERQEGPGTGQEGLTDQATAGESASAQAAKQADLPPACNGSLQAQPSSQSPHQDKPTTDVVSASNAVSTANTAVSTSAPGDNLAATTTSASNPQATNSVCTNTTNVQHSHSDNNVISIEISMDPAVLNEAFEGHSNQPHVTQEVPKPATTQAPVCTDAHAKSAEVSKQKSTVSVTEGQDKKSIVKAATGGHNLWISGLSSTTRAADLKNLFSKHGKVTGAKVVTNAKSPGSKCYGFVTMSGLDETDKCIKHLNRTELHGKIISVERAKAEPSVNSVLSKKPTIVKAVAAAEVAKTATADVEKKGAGKKEDGGMKNDGGRGDGWKSEGLRRIDYRRGDRFGREPLRNKYRRPATSMTYMRGRRDFNILTLDKIREARERERGRERERLARQEERRQQMMIMREKERQREVERMQREEAARLDREKEKLRLEKQRLEYDKIVAERERVSLEREKQRREREKLEREREERKKEMLRQQSENKPSRRQGEDWDESKRKAPSFAYPSRYYGSSRKDSAEKKHRVDSKGRHDSSSSRTAGREDSKSRKQEERSRVEWRAVSKNDASSSSSFHHRPSRDTMAQQNNYHFQTTAWPSSNRSQMATWNASSSVPSFNYLPPPPSFNLSRAPSTRYDPYKAPRRY